MRKIIGLILSIVFITPVWADNQEIIAKDEVQLCVDLSEFNDMTDIHDISLAWITYNNTNPKTSLIGREFTLQSGIQCNIIKKGKINTQNEGVLGITISQNIENTQKVLYSSVGVQNKMRSIQSITYHAKVYRRLDGTLSATVLHKTITTTLGKTYSESGDLYANFVGDFTSQAVQKLYDIGATKYKTVQTFMAGNDFTREQAAKFFVEVWKAIHSPNNEQGGMDRSECHFIDSDYADPTLKNYIYNACQLGLMKGVSEQQKFYPKAYMSAMESITVMMRLYGMGTDMKEQPWYLPYYNGAINIDLFRYIPYKPQLGQFGSFSRGYVALALYRLLELEGK